MPLTLYPEPLPDEIKVRECIRKIVDLNLRPFAIEDDEKQFFRRSVFNDFAALGLTALTMPKLYGGGGESFRCHYACVEEICRGSMALGVAVGVTNLVQGALSSYGTTEQKENYLKKLISGKLLGAFSLSEPGSGSDAAALVCAGNKVEGGYRITGNKIWCSNAGLADVYLLMARTGKPKTKGITAFLIPKDTKGFRIGKQEQKLGLRGSTLAELVFEDCFIPDNLRVGKEGQGLTVALSQLDSGRIGIAACALGISLEALERVFRLRTEEAAKGIPFPDGQKQKLAVHFANLQSIKSLLWHIADLKDQGKGVTLLASQVKLLASDLAMNITSDVVEFSGERGYTREFEVERLMRDTKALQIVEGTNQIQCMVIAREMAKSFGGAK